MWLLVWFWQQVVRLFQHQTVNQGCFSASAARLQDSCSAQASLLISMNVQSK